MTRVVFALCLAFFAASSAALAQDIADGWQWLQEIWHPPKISADAPDTAYARFGLDAAPWVAEATAELARLRGAGARATHVVLLRGAGDRIYLAIRWDDDIGRSVQILVAPPASEQADAGVPTLRFVREVSDDYVDLVAPTGTRPFPDEPPVLAIRHAGTIGSVRIILLTGDTIDVTPDWAGRTIGLRDLDHDGTAEIVAIDENWHGFAFYCGTCGPAVVTILRRERGHTRFACTDFPEVFRPFLSMPTYGEDWWSLLSRVSQTALLNAQVGQFDQAETAATALVRIATMYDAYYLDQSSLHMLEVAEEIADNVRRASASGQEAGCPLSAVSRPYAWTPW